MHPDFRQEMVNDHERQLEQSVRNARLLHRDGASEAASTESVILRLCSVHDDGALERLAMLESRPVPKGRFVVAEVGGTVVAALPLDSGTALADPFRQTAHLLPLLELRAKQLAPAGRRTPVALLGAVRGWVRA
jgi:hypothetical protein